MLDEQALARLGAIGLTFSDDKGFTLASDRVPLENRPWSPAPAPARDDRLVRPGHGASHGADPADPAEDPGARMKGDRVEKNGHAACQCELSM